MPKSKKKWERTGSKALLKHPRISVYEDDIVLPNGSRSTYIHLGEEKNSVAIVAVDDTGRGLVQKEYSYPPDQWLYQFPGGGVEDGEELYDAALRELSEESDVTGDLELMGWYYTDNRRKKDKQHVFLAKNITPFAGQKDPEEDFENYWFEPKKIDSMIKDGEVLTESMLAAWSIYKNYQ
jgi:ADP-ribose pyrophosphatase